MPATVAGSVREALDAAADALWAAAVEGPRLDAELLLAEAMGVERARLAAAPEAPVEAAAARDFGSMVRRRVAREPVAYILGRKGFRNLELAVDPRVLIPRPETELLVDLAVELGPVSAVDVGTGSGAVALAIAEELPTCTVVGTDTSPGALRVAAANAIRLGLDHRVAFEAGSLPAGRDFELLVANLPYVRSSEWSGLQPEITRFEPRAALVGGDDGLGPIRSLVGSLSPAGGDRPLRAAAVGLEVGVDQAERVAELLGAAGFTQAEIRRDLAGRERVVTAR
jgi:release factor glutamine methyltransferase